MQVKNLRDENSSLRSLYTPNLMEGWGGSGAGLEHLNSSSVSSSPIHHPHFPSHQLAHHHQHDGTTHSVSGSPRHHYYSPVHQHGAMPYSLHNGDSTSHVSNF